MAFIDCFTDNTSLIKDLSKVKLNYDHLIDKIENLYLLRTTSQFHSDSVIYYFSYCQLWRGKILERIFAVKRTRKKIYIEEVIRKLEGYNYFLVKNLYFTYISGYHVCFSYSRPSVYCFHKDDYNRWFITKNHYDIHIDGYLFIYDDLINLDSSLKYCAYNFNYSLHKYISIYRQFPQLEFLSKFNLLRFLSSSKFIDLLNDNNFIKYLIKNKSHHLMTEIQPRFLISCYKKNISLTEYEKILLDRQRKKVENVTFEDTFKYDVTRFNNDIYSFILPKNKFDLIDEGNALHHCVGRMGYDKKIINGNSLIIFMRLSFDINKPLYTLEYDLHLNKFIQFYGDHNSLPDDDAKSFIYNYFLPRFNECIGVGLK